MQSNHKYSQRFLEAIQKVLQNEGGYVDDPDDAGGETNFGISRKYFPDLDIKHLTRDLAIDIYFYNYWKPVKGDLIISNELAFQVFDMAVNAGSGVAIKLLQQIVGVLPDGSIGPLTLKAMDKYPSVTGMIEKYKFARAKFYCNLVSKNHSQAKFLKGWINRIES